MTIHVYNGRRSITSHALEFIIRGLGTKKTYASYDKTRELVLKKGNMLPDDYTLKQAYLSHSINVEMLLHMRVYTVNDKQDADQHTILYIHGGAWLNPPLRFHWNLIDYMAKQLDAKIVVPIYPKVPHSNYLDVYSRMLPLYRTLISDIVDNENFTIMGDSAGGNIILGLLQLINTNKLPRPKKVILLSACVDMSLSNPDITDYDPLDPRLSAKGIKAIVEFWSNGTEVEDPLISPIYGDFNADSKFYHFIGTHDILYPDAMKFHDKLLQDNIDITTFVYPKMNHVFPVLPLPVALHARQKIVEIIQL